MANRGLEPVSYLLSLCCTKNLRFSDVNVDTLYAYDSEGKVYQCTIDQCSKC